jgi:hypothetical protein
MEPVPSKLARGMSRSSQQIDIGQKSAGVPSIHELEG